MDPRSRQQRRASERRRDKREVSSQPIPIGEVRYQGPSHAGEWVARRSTAIPKGELFELTLSRGDRITARRLPIAALMEMGHIPNRLLPTILSWMEPFKNVADSGGTDADVEKAINAIIQRDPKPFLELLAIVWTACVVDPITMPDDQYNGAPGTIPLQWVHLEDMEYVFDWAQGVDESVVAFFRRRQAAGLSMVGAVPEGGDVPGGVPGDRDDQAPVDGVPVERSSGSVGSSGLESITTDPMGDVHPIDYSDEGHSDPQSLERPGYRPSNGRSHRPRGEAAGSAEDDVQRDAPPDE